MTLALRIGLALLAITELVIGAWNQFWPRGFYTDFPTVELTPPFSEHFARDFGGATLALGIVLAAAAIVPRTILVVPTLIGLTVFAIPHFVFHMNHLEHATSGDALFLAVSLGLSAAAPPLLLALAVVRWRREVAASRVAR